MERDKLIESNRKLIGDINECITQLISSKNANDNMIWGKTFFRMESLLTACMQQLTCNNDYLHDMTTDTTGCELCRKEMTNKE